MELYNKPNINVMEKKDHIREIPIYTQGGGNSILMTGGATKYMLNDIEINMGLAEGRNHDSHILYTFKISDISELDEWLYANNHDFLAKCVRKFKIHMIYSNAIKGVFFDIVKLFEGFVLKIIRKLGLDEKMTLEKYNQVNIDQNLESSSIILHQFGKDKQLNELLMKEQPILVECISDHDSWSYIGWCPLVPDIRLKALFGFPLEKVVLYLGEDIDLIGFYNDITKLEKKTTPGICQTEYKHGDFNNKSDKINALHTRIKENMEELQKWEDYYSEAAEQVLSIASIFKKYFKDFGTH